MLNNDKGFTLIEVIMAVSILSGIVYVVSMFGLDLFNLQVFLGDSFTMQQEINLTLTAMAVEARSMGPSANGSYPIESASATSLTFYSDIDGDNDFERVRYFVSSNTLYKGVIEPSGNPAVYLAASESFKDVVHNVILPPIASQSLFVFYDQNYDGSQDPLPQPVDVNRIRLMKVTITSDRTSQDLMSRLEYSLMILMRNLRNTQQ